MRLFYLAYISLSIFFISCSSDQNSMHSADKKSDNKVESKYTKNNSNIKLEPYYQKLATELKISKNKIHQLQKFENNIDKKWVTARKNKTLNNKKRRQFRRQLDRACQRIIGKDLCTKRKEFDKKNK